MDDEELFSIGTVARRTGLTVKAVRFYADAGIVRPTGRTAAGYRLYDLEALARLDLLRTLRELGLDLGAIRRVLDREVSIPELAAAHVDALDVQIRTLRLRRAVLRAVAEHGYNPQEMALMHALAKLSVDERRRLIADFIDTTFGGLDANDEFVELLRLSMPELPDDATAEQVEAWVELAELIQDADFRAAVRRMAEYQAAERAGGDRTGLHGELTEFVRATVVGALDSGIQPESVEAGPIIDAITARYALEFDRPNDAALRQWLMERLQIANDPRAERYWSLLAVINGWPVPMSLAPAFAWLIAALGVHPVAR